MKKASTQAKAQAHCIWHKHKDQNLSFLRDHACACVAGENQALEFLKLLALIW